MKNRIFLFVLFIHLPLALLAQNTPVSIDLDSLGSATYTDYSPPYDAKMIYQDTIDARNSTVEELMSSIISADTQEWIDYNTKGGAKFSDKKDEKSLARIKERTRDANFFRLISKLEFSYSNRTMAIVKFYLHLEENDLPVAGAMVLEKNISGKWQVSSEPTLTPISTCMMIFKEPVMRRILLNNPLGELEEKLVKVAYSAKGLDFNKLIAIEYSAEDREYLTNPLNW